MSKIYALREWLKLELRKRKMRKVELIIKDNYIEKCGALTASGKILIDSAWIEKLDLEILTEFTRHELDHIQIYRVLRGTPKIERKMQDSLDKEFETYFKKKYGV